LALAWGLFLALIAGVAAWLALKGPIEPASSVGGPSVTVQLSDGLVAPERIAAPSTPAETAQPAPEPFVDPALVVDSADGPLPVIAADGRQAWQAYARPFDPAERRPRIAIVIGELGLSRAPTGAAIAELPAAVTLAFVPYAKDVQYMVREARGRGHEVLIHLPMEPIDYPSSDPGPKALLTSLGAGENIKRLNWVMAQASGYVGLMGAMGSKFTASAEHMQPIIEAVKSRGLLYLDSRTSARSAAAQIARAVDLPFAFNDRFLDASPVAPDIDKELKELERLAQASGAALGIGSAYPVTIERIKAWADGLNSRGFVLAPVSALANRQGGR
jgi:polysaccharide deacetylase 2 family uncharacterized protein YibQ